jgi:HK97 family phage major capsid protein
MEKKTPAQIEVETKARKTAIEAAEKAYNDFEIKGPEDVAKSFDLQKSLFELKMADGDAKAEAKMEALNEAVTELKTKDADAKKVAEKLEVTIKALDMLQTRVKNQKGNRDPIYDTDKKSFGAMLSEGIEEIKDGLSALKEKKTGSTSFQMKAVADMTFPVNFPTAGASVTYVRPGIIELPKRKLHIRELLPGGSMGANATFNYVKEVTGDYLGVPSGSGPAPVAEATLKPQLDLKLVEASVPAQWIAGWVRISRNMLDDVTGMTTFLQSRLPELLLRAEDTQLLTGNGSGSNLSGILNGGNNTPYSGTATIDIEQLVGAVAQLEGYDREANGILLNPADWYNIWLTKSTGSVAGLYNLPNEMIQRVNGQMFIAGIPVFRSTAIAVDTFIVGDWTMGANLISREPMRVEFFYEDGINVRENMVTVRVEERVAFPIYGDNYFIRGDFGNTSS